MKVYAVVVRRKVVRLYKEDAYEIAVQYMDKWNSELGSKATVVEMPVYSK